MDPWHFGMVPDPRLWPMDPDPAIFVLELHVFLLINFLMYYNIIFLDKKS